MLRVRQLNAFDDGFILSGYPVLLYDYLAVMAVARTIWPKANINGTIEFFFELFIADLDSYQWLIRLVGIFMKEYGNSVRRDFFAEEILACSGNFFYKKMEGDFF
ncbi:MAG: hypothetical protein MUD12_11490 [Spirochaetes bacterium]|nr:hypothetical protein [Spirochaetota bacterium]